MGLEEHVEILCKEMNLKQFNVLIKSLQNENGPSSFRNMIIEYNVITPDDSYGLNSLEEEFDLEEAECREEKRWMERENKKLTKKMKKEENGRLIYLVNLSYKYDPRIINWKEEQEKEKLRKKAERKAAKIRRREEANREAREEQERKEAEAKAIEEKKENEAKQRAIENKQIRKKRPQLRKICRLAREEHDSDPINNPFNPL